MSKAVISTFGYVPYGKKVIGTLIYPPDHFGCKPFNMNGYTADKFKSKA